MTRGSLRDILVEASNDYGQLINLGSRPAPSLTVVIPWYRGNQFLTHLAAGLNSQDDQDFQIVIVDDDPSQPFPEEALAAFARRPSVLRHQRNYGGPSAKNTGLAFAATDAVLFLDQDMMLPSNAIADLRRLLAIDERLVAVGFRSTATVGPGGTLPRARLENDWRALVTPDATFLPATASLPATVAELRTYRLLDETDEFRAFGHGRVIGLWDLPVMVVGHTLAAHTSLLRRAGGLPEILPGWGTDDTALGAFLIAVGALIVPATQVVSTQLAHRPWAGSRDRQLIELGANLERYRRMLDSPVRLDKPARRRFRRTGKSFLVELTEH